MKPEDAVRIRHMVDSIQSAIRFTQGRKREELKQDEMLAFALVRAIEVIGEAATKVSVETRDAHGNIPWAAIINMRHRLVHAYFDINHDILWTTATEAVPALLPQLLHLLPAD